MYHWQRNALREECEHRGIRCFNTAGESFMPCTSTLPALTQSARQILTVAEREAEKGDQTIRRTFSMTRSTTVARSPSLRRARSRSRRRENLQLSVP